MTRALSVLVLGSSVILLAGVLPLAQVRGQWPSAWAAPPALALVAGVGLLLARRTTPALVALLVGVPAGLVALLVVEGARLDAFGTLGLAGACGALIAYGVAIAHAVAESTPLASATEKGLAGAAPTPDDRGRRWLARAWLALGAAAGLALVVVAPTLGTRSELRRSFGDAAEDVEVLVALAGAAAALLVVGIGVAGPTRRLRRDGSLPKLRRGRAVAWLLVAAAGALLLVLRTMA